VSEGSEEDVIESITERVIWFRIERVADAEGVDCGEKCTAGTSDAVSSAGGFFFSSRSRHTRSSTVSWARRCV